MENKMFNVISFDEDGSVCTMQIPDRELYTISIDVGDTRVAVNPIRVINKIEAGMLMQTDNRDLIVDLVNGKSYTKVIEDTIHDIPNAPTWSKKMIMFYSYSSARIESIEKSIKYFIKHKAKTPYDCLTFNV